MATRRKKSPDWDIEPVCPKCDAVLFEPDEDLPSALEEDGDEMTMTCEDCGCRCKVQLGVTIEFLVEEA
jgi:RNase P subunit RPR2